VQRVVFFDETAAFVTQSFLSKTFVEDVHSVGTDGIDDVALLCDGVVTTGLMGVLGIVGVVDFM